MLVCSLSFGSFFLMPKYHSFVILNDMVFAKEAELSIKQDYFSQIEKISKDLEKYPEVMAKIEMALPLEPNFALFLEFLQQTTSHTGLILKQTNFFYGDSSKNKESLEGASVSFKISGKLENFSEFLVSLEKSAGLIEVLSIHFNTPEEGDIFTFDVRVKIHFLE